MLKRVSTLIEYVTFLYKQSIASGNIFRIIQVETDKNDEKIATIQVINKTTTFRCTINEIVSEDKLLECFSKSDIRMITFLATKDMLAPKNKIVGFDNNHQKGHTVLKIKAKNSELLRAVTADKISVEIGLDNLNQEDAYKSGYLVGVEEMLLEKKAMEMIRNASDGRTKIDDEK